MENSAKMDKSNCCPESKQDFWQQAKHVTDLEINLIFHCYRFPINLSDFDITDPNFAAIGLKTYFGTFLIIDWIWIHGFEQQLSVS